MSSGDMLFTAGEIGIDPATGELVAGDVAAETRQVLANLQAIVQAAGCSLDDVVKTTVYLTDITDFQGMNEAYGAAFTSEPPARSTVGVAALPLDARVMIEAIARVPR